MILSEPGPIPQAPVGQFCRHNLSPRGDGNFDFLAVKLRLVRHNLSPRGDGNSRDVLIFQPTALTQLIPARGRKQRDLCSKYLLYMDTTYPREGTETYFCFALLSLLSNLTQLIPARGRKRFDLLFFRHLYPTQLIPARGRKRLRRIGRSSRVPDTTYPREGTETPTPPQSRQSGRTQLIPARGRKRCGASGGQAVCRDTTYPREGTET